MPVLQQIAGWITAKEVLKTWICLFFYVKLQITDNNNNIYLKESYNKNKM